ncbi:MAG TPA: hypothetical protein VGB42_09455, partial [Candidatus Thermoplasmatota archaeon]
MSPADRLDVADVMRGLRFVAALPRLFRRPLNPTDARAVLARRLEQREADFVALMRRVVFGNLKSPYRRLLGLAGCEQGDLAQLVASEGVESSLERLARHGVFLTVDEAKGRAPVVRGSSTFELDPADLANPGAAAHLLYRTSGSRGAGTLVSVDVAHFRDRAVNTALVLAARGGWSWRHALWGVPGGAAITVLLEHAALGVPPVAWFSQVDPRSPNLDPRYAWSTRVLRWAGRVLGTVLPSPVTAPLARPAPVVGWIRECLGAGQAPHLITFPSSAVELCRAAREAGVELAGLELSIGGEPITSVRLAAIRAAGAHALPRYGSMESGRIGDGCLAPKAPDDIHVFHDLHAVVQPGAGDGQRTVPRTLLFSSLRDSAPVVLLNVSLGDQAVLARRRCRCPLEELGWTTHLHTIRSDEKLTAAGMTLLDGDAISALEEVLPARFGGVATDYQLLEEEDAAGRPRLVLVVSPRVGA